MKDTSSWNIATFPSTCFLASSYEFLRNEFIDSLFSIRIVGCTTLMAVFIIITFAVIPLISVPEVLKKCGRNSKDVLVVVKLEFFFKIRNFKFPNHFYGGWSMQNRFFSPFSQFPFDYFRNFFPALLYYQQPISPKIWFRRNKMNWQSYHPFPGPVQFTANIITTAQPFFNGFISNPILYKAFLSNAAPLCNTEYFLYHLY